MTIARAGIDDFRLVRIASADYRLKRCQEPDCIYCEDPPPFFIATFTGIASCGCVVLPPPYRSYRLNGIETLNRCFKLSRKQHPPDQCFWYTEESVDEIRLNWYWDNECKSLAAFETANQVAVELTIGHVTGGGNGLVDSLWLWTMPLNLSAFLAIRPHCDCRNLPPFESEYSCVGQAVLGGGIATVVPSYE